MRKDSRQRTTYGILFLLVTLLSSAGVYLLNYPTKKPIQKTQTTSATKTPEKTIAPVVRALPQAVPQPQLPPTEPVVEPTQNPMMSAMIPEEEVKTITPVTSLPKKISTPRKLANVETTPVAPAPAVEVAQPAAPVAEPVVVVEPPVKQVVKLEVVTPPEKIPLALKPPPKVGAKFFLGAGLNYFRYQENLSDVNTNYNGMRGPSYLVGAHFSITDRTDVMASYKSTPIYFDNASVGFSQLQSNWNILELQGSTKINRFSTSSRDVSFLYGLQFHEMPLALFKNLDNQPALRTLSSANASLGASSMCYLNPWTRTSIFGRLQYPVSSETVSGSSVTVKPQLLFDGSVGIEKNISQMMWLGLHWYGQYQKIKFKYTDPLIAADGQQSAIFSTLELRMNLDY